MSSDWGQFRKWAVGALCSLVLGGIALAQDAPAAAATSATAEERARAVEGKYVAPPQKLHEASGHWTPYEPPAPPEGAEVHVVESGDCLWNLSQKFYGDPYLWPRIWDANRYVTYSHWIYPGDPLVIPGKPNVVSSATPAAAQPQIQAAVEANKGGDANEAPAAAPSAPSAPAGPVLVAAAEQTEIACSAQLFEHFDPGPLHIAGRDVAEKKMQAQGDVVFLSGGRDMDIQPGSEYSVVRAAGTVKDPQTKKSLATFVRRLGRLRVLAVQASRATAEITISCEDLAVGDFLLPYKETPLPLVERMPLARLLAQNPGRLNGRVILTVDPRASIAGTGDLVGIDLSSHAGVTAGDRVIVWRNAENAEVRRAIAQGIVLSAAGGGSTVKILEANSEIFVGDPVEVR